MIAKDTLKFLSDLKKNNNRDWFLSQKTGYEAYKKNAVEIAEGIIAQLAEHDPGVKKLDPKKCLFRINRDIRFSKDKSPYKTHLGIWMSPTETGGEWLPGYYIQIEPGNSFLAGGIWQPSAEILKKIRKEIAFFHEDLKEIVEAKKFKETFGGLSTEDSLKTAPKGYEKDHPAIDFLKLKSIIATKPISDSDLNDKNFEKTVADILSVVVPLNNFITRGVSNPED